VPVDVPHGPGRRTPRCRTIQPCGGLNKGGAIGDRIGIRRAAVTPNASGCSIAERICGRARYAAFKLARSRIAGRICCIALYT
jgi:hypothetical protein